METTTVQEMEQKQLKPTAWKPRLISILLSVAISDNFKDKKIPLHTLKAVAILINRLKVLKHIISILDNQDDFVNLTIMNVYDWLSNTRVVSTANIIVEVYITIKITRDLSKLIKNQLDVLKEIDINLSAKYIINKHTNRVRIIISPNLEQGNPSYYKQINRER